MNIKKQRHIAKNLAAIINESIKTIDLIGNNSNCKISYEVLEATTMNLLELYTRTARFARA